MNAWKERGPLEAFPVSLCALATCVIVFFLTDVPAFQERFATLKLQGMNWLPGFASGELWRPVTSIFLHGSLMHVFVNCYSLYALAPSLEARIGSARFAAIFFGAGIAGSLCSMALDESSVGASGAIFGILGVYVRTHRVACGSWGGVLRHPVGSQALGWLVLNIVLGFTLPRISNAAHLGGLFGGWVISAGLLPAGKGIDRGLILSQVSWPKTATAIVAILGLAAPLLLWIAPRTDSVLARKALDAARDGDAGRAQELAGKAGTDTQFRRPGSVRSLAWQAAEEGHFDLAARLVVLSLPAGRTSQVGEKEIRALRKELEEAVRSGKIPEDDP